jgi:hypothetical protein
MRTVEDSGARGTDQCSVVPCHLLQGRAFLFRAVRCGVCDFLVIIFCSRSPYSHSVCELVNMSWSTMRVGQHELVGELVNIDARATARSWSFRRRPTETSEQQIATLVAYVAAPHCAPLQLHYLLIGLISEDSCPSYCCERVMFMRCAHRFLTKQEFASKIKRAKLKFRLENGASATSISHQEKDVGVQGCAESFSMNRRWQS